MVPAASGRSARSVGALQQVATGERLSKSGGATARRPPDLDPAISLELVREGPLFDEAKRFQYRVFRTSGFCRPSLNEVVEEYEPWSERSTFHVATIDHTEVVGCVRTIVGSYADLPVGRLERNVRQPEDPICEIASLAVKPDVRTAGITEALYRSAFARCVREGLIGFVSAMDDWLIDLLSGHYGLPVRPVGPSRRFMGGDVSPAGAILAELYEKTPRERPEFWRWTLEEFSAEEVARYDLPIVLP